MNILVFLPTYNEAGNIEKLINTILQINPRYHVLVVDDRSPDGTANIVRNLKKKLPGVFLIQRDPPKGRGLAGKDGFLFALEKQYDVLVEMDADFSHDPHSIPSLVAATANSDVVIGSRYVRAGSDIKRGKIRQFVSLVSNSYIRFLLGIPVKDCTSGFRAFNRDAINKINPTTLTAAGPETVEEILYRCHKSNCSINEIPIQFKDRNLGKSKLNFKTLLKILLIIPKIRLSKTE